MQRVGDADRDAAVQLLRDHTSAGRLTLEEFDERMTKALQARTHADLVELFTDLPGGAPNEPRPELTMQPLTDAKAKGVAKRSSSSNAVEAAKVGAVAAIWIVFLLGVFTGTVAWWLFWIPMIVSGIITDDIGKKRKDDAKELE